MELRESVRGWRLWGSVGAFRAAVGVLLLGLVLAQSDPPQICDAAEAPQDITQPMYKETAEKESSVGSMVPLVNSFLHTVQPKPFPEDLILRIIRDLKKGQLNKEIVKEFLMYEAGFLVCTAIGVLYIVLMPIVGIFLLCCGCCGKLYQKQTSSIHCRRRTLYWALSVTTFIILVGSIFMFKSNQSIKVSVDQSQAELNKTLDNIQSFLTAVPQQVDYVVNESFKTIDKVTSNLDAIGPQLGKEIKEEFRGSLDPALESVRLLDQEIGNVDLQVKQLDASLTQLQSSMDRLQANITAVKDQISQTLSKPDCIQCSQVNDDLQTPDFTISSPNLKDLKDAVAEAIKTDLASKVTQAEDFFNSIPNTVTQETNSLVQSSKQELGNIKTQISSITKDIPLSALTNVTKTLNQAQKEIDRVTPNVKKAEEIRWGVCAVLCCVILLVVVCNFVGLMLGPLGLSPKADPTQRSCTADCGGTFLMMSAGFSFFFSWLFMVVGMLLFLLGGNFYTLLCRPWHDGQLLKLIDTPGLIPGLDNIGQTLGLKTSINISEIYADCEKNQPLWTTLHLHKLINLEEVLSISKYTEQIQQTFDSTDITLSTITLLSPDVKNQLISFSSKATNDDFTAVTQQIKNISNVNLNTTADRLDQLATAQPPDIKKELQDSAKDLRKIQSDIEMTIPPQLEKLTSTIKSLESITAKISVTVGEVLSKVGAAQDFLNTNSTQIVKNESRKFLDCQLAYFTVYVDWAKLMITQQMGRCGPVAGAVETVEVILCSHIVESLNVFWFSLGWCMIFFIPSIIFSMKLAKYYLRMKYSDGYDDPMAVHRTDSSLSQQFDNVLSSTERDGPLVRKWVPHGDSLVGKPVFQIVVPEKFHDEVLKTSHDQLGHLGVRKMYEYILRYFFWPRVKGDVFRYIKTCHTCQMTGTCSVVSHSSCLTAI